MLIPKVTDTDFLNNGYSSTVIGEIEDLGAIKTLSFNDYFGHREKSIGIYDDFLVLPNTLVEHQNILRITENISTKLNAELRYTITNDMEHYYVQVNGEFIETHNFKNGMSLDMLQNVDLTHWDGKIGIGISIQEKTPDRELWVGGLFVMLNKTINIMSEGVYKINYGTLIDTDIGSINVYPNNGIDSMFTVGGG